jgi:protoheme IX farnesyltransferase
MIKDYYRLTKPGIIYGNSIAAIGGFFFATQHEFSLSRFLGMLFGLSLVIASGCVFNNYIDRGIDKKMKRTKKRALVTGNISNTNAILFGGTLGIIGVWLLISYTNMLTALVAVFGFIAYVVLYGIAKRLSVHGPAIGSISGAVPPVVGYVAVTNQLDVAAFLLFLILVCWQMPHFYAIAIFRMKDYAAASIPVLPIKKGMYNTKVQIFLYILAFSITSFSLSALGYTGYTYLIVMAIVSVLWVRLAVAGFNAKNDNAWAGKLFGFSLYTLLIFSFIISVDRFLP